MKEKRKVAKSNLTFIQILAPNFLLHRLILLIRFFKKGDAAIPGNSESEKMRRRIRRFLPFSSNEANEVNKDNFHLFKNFPFLSIFNCLSTALPSFSSRSAFSHLLIFHSCRLSFPANILPFLFFFLLFQVTYVCSSSLSRARIRSSFFYLARKSIFSPVVCLFD